MRLLLFLCLLPAGALEVRYVKLNWLYYFVGMYNSASVEAL